MDLMAEFITRLGIMPPTQTPMPDYDAYEKEGLPINEIQRLQFELLRRVRYNNLNGATVVEDLLNWRDLWYAVLADRCTSSTGKLYEPVVDLIRLRDLPRNYWNVDYVFVWSDADKVEHLHSMVKERWKPDATEVLSEEEATRLMGSTLGEKDRVLAVWWD